VTPEHSHLTATLTLLGSAGRRRGGDAVTAGASRHVAAHCKGRMSTRCDTHMLTAAALRLQHELAVFPTMDRASATVAVLGCHTSRLWCHGLPAGVRRTAAGDAEAAGRRVEGGGGSVADGGAAAQPRRSRCPSRVCAPAQVVVHRGVHRGSDIGGPAH
jgi:hypothetical protein